MNDPYVRDILHAYRCGASIHAISKAVGLSWLEVRRIVKKFAIGQCGSA